MPPAGADAQRANFGPECARQGFDVQSDIANKGTEMSTKPDNGTETKSERPRVLLVDDYPDAREMYTEYLEFSGFEVIEAENGMEALERAVDAKPDIILMDLSLPVM